MAILCKCVIPNPFRTYDFFGRIHLMQRRVHQTSSMEWPSVTKADPCRPVIAVSISWWLYHSPLNSNDIAWFLAWLRFTMFLILFDGRTYRNSLQHGRWTPIRFYVFPVDLSVHWSNSMCEYVFNAILHLDKVVLKCLTQCSTWLHCHANLLGGYQPMTDPCPSRSQWPAPEKKSPMKRLKWYSYIPRCSIVLEYLPTKLGHFFFFVGKYSIHAIHGASGIDSDGHSDPQIWNLSDKWGIFVVNFKPDGHISNGVYAERTSWNDQHMEEKTPSMIG